jgi:hypothetical protein
MLTSFLFLLHLVDTFIKCVYVIADLVAKSSLSHFYVTKHLLEMEQNSRVSSLANTVSRVQTFLQEINFSLKLLHSKRPFFLFSRSLRSKHFIRIAWQLGSFRARLTFSAWLLCWPITWLRSYILILLCQLFLNSSQGHLKIFL